MAFDVQGKFSFVYFKRSVSPYEAGLAISSDKFSGEKNCNNKKPGRNLSARSCEIWAVTISAFDRADMVFRSSESDSGIKPIGDIRVISTAGLVLRRRGS